MAARGQCWLAVLVLLAAVSVTQVRSQVYVSEARDQGLSHPSVLEDDAGRRRLSSPSSSSEDRVEDAELSARLDRLQVLDARLSQMDVLDKMFQFVQLDTNMARISAQVDRLSERLTEQTSRPVTCSPASTAGPSADQAAIDTRMSVLEKAVEGVGSQMNTQLNRLHRQLDALLERNVQLNTKTDTMLREVSQLVESSNIVDDQLEQADNNLRYLRDELEIVKQKTHAIHHQQHKSETAIKEEIEKRVGSTETGLKTILFTLYTDVSQLSATINRWESAAAPALQPREDRHYEDDYDEELEHPLSPHPLENADFRAKLVNEIRDAVAADSKKIMKAVDCPKRRDRKQAEIETASLLRGIQHTINSTLGRAVTAQQRPSDCSELIEQAASSGVFTIHPNACSRGHKMQVFCDMETSGGGWTVIQRRGQFPGRNQLDFYKDWNTYKWGFGNISEEFYLGNELIHLLTTSDDFVLRVELEDFSGDRRYAEYEHFSLDGDALHYRLHVGHYNGNAGDAMSFHNGLGFTTKDQEHDTWDGKNCATHYRGGWWFANCHRANLNGMYLTGHHSNYGNGIIWYPWRGFTYSLKSSRMMVRPRRVHENIPGGQR